MNRALNLALFTLVALSVRCQQIDSVRIFRDLPVREYSTSSAESTAWQLDRSKALSISISGTELEPLARLLSEQDPIEHGHSELPELTHLGFAYAKGGKYAFGVMHDLGTIVNFTIRREYRLPEGAERTGVKLLLKRALH